jgi:hypothetical protein
MISRGKDHDAATPTTTPNLWRDGWKLRGVTPLGRGSVREQSGTSFLLRRQCFTHHRRRDLPGPGLTSIHDYADSRTCHCPDCPCIARGWRGPSPLGSAARADPARRSGIDGGGSRRRAGHRLAARAGVHGADHRDRGVARAGLVAAPRLARVGHQPGGGHPRLRDPVRSRAGDHRLGRPAGDRAAEVRVDRPRPGNLRDRPPRRAGHRPRAAAAGGGLAGPEQAGGRTRGAAEQHRRAGDQLRVPAGAAAVPQRRGRGHG